MRARTRVAALPKIKRRLILNDTRENDVRAQGLHWLIKITLKSEQQSLTCKQHADTIITLEQHSLTQARFSANK